MENSPFFQSILLVRRLPRCLADSTQGNASPFSVTFLTSETFLFREKNKHKHLVLLLAGSGSRIFSGLNFVRTQNFLDPKIFFDTFFLDPKLFQAQNFFRSKNFFQANIFFPTKIFSDPKYFPTKIFQTQILFGP